jgi:hypothetical protein
MKRTSKNWAEILRAYVRFKGNISHFCKEWSIQPGALRYHVNKQSDGNGDSFITVQSADHSRFGHGVAARIQVPVGVELLLYEGASRAFISNLITAVSECFRPE